MGSKNMIGFTVNSIGSNSSVLNKSFLVDQMVTFIQPRDVDNYLAWGPEYFEEVFSDFEKEIPTVEKENGEVVFSIPLAPKIFVTSTVESFFEEDSKLFVRFARPVKIPNENIENTDVCLNDQAIVLIYDYDSRIIENLPLAIDIGQAIERMS